MINDIVYLFTAFFCIIGVAVSVWSIIDTRNRAYSDYLRRKGKL